MRTVAEMVRSEVPGEELEPQRGGCRPRRRNPARRPVGAGGTGGEGHHRRSSVLEFWADPSSPYHRPEFDPEAPLILYCASGGRSALAATLLEEMGYRQV